MKRPASSSAAVPAIIAPQARRGARRDRAGGGNACGRRSSSPTRTGRRSSSTDASSSRTKTDCSISPCRGCRPPSNRQCREPRSQPFGLAGFADRRAHIAQGLKSARMAGPHAAAGGRCFGSSCRARPRSGSTAAITLRRHGRWRRPSPISMTGCRGRSC